MFRYLIVIVACALLGAHHLRAGETGLVAMWLSAPTLLLLLRPWVPLLLQLLLTAGCGVWGQAAFRLVALRMADGGPWLRLVAILGGVVLFTALAASMLSAASVRRRYRSDSESSGWAVGAFVLTAALLVIVQKVVQPPGILLERFVVGGGWLTAFWLAVWAAWLTDTLGPAKRMRQLRPRIWLAFSTVFFAQLAIGLAGVDAFLMTGDLHLPVPALIVAGPVFRGGELFMLVLFAATVVIVGPAWCSWLCYIGALDDRFARIRTKPKPLPSWRRHLRVLLFVAVVATAALLKLAGASPAVAGYLALGFGIIGIAVMAWASRATGTMVHCTAYCPIGLLATRFGRLSPFRIRISPSCTRCGACSLTCRYDALHEHHVERRIPGEACTLCGDCVAVCASGAIDFHFLRLRPETARRLFVMLVTSLHAVFLGVARM